MFEVYRCPGKTRLTTLTLKNVSYLLPIQCFRTGCVAVWAGLETVENVVTFSSHMHFKGGVHEVSVQTVIYLRQRASIAGHLNSFSICFEVQLEEAGEDTYI